MGMLQAEATITTATDTSVIAAVESGQHIVIHEIHASVFGTNAGAKIRFEDAAGGTLLGGLGVGDGATAIGPVLAKEFPNGYKLGEAKGLFVESTNTATWYVYAKYSIRETAQ